MILAIRQQKPLLEFELGETTKIAKANEVVLINLSNTFASNVITNLQTSLPVKKVSDNIWAVTYDGIGSKNIVLFATTADKTFQKYSNTLTIKDK